MKQTQLIMGMPITVEIIDVGVDESAFIDVFNYFSQVDNRFSTYKNDSEISKVNLGLPKSKWSPQMKTVLDLCEQTKQKTAGYFDIWHEGKLDPSGLVKGWAIQNAASVLKSQGFNNFYVEAGGDIQVSGHNSQDQAWQVGIRNPFNHNEVIKTLAISDRGVATSGAYIRGPHIYNPLDPEDQLDKVASLTVVGPDIFNTDCLVTAAYAMGEKKGIVFIEDLEGYEAYVVGHNKVATLTSGFERYVLS